MRTVLVNVDRVEHVTDDAFLFVIDGDEVWIPKSQVEDPDEIEIGDEDIGVNIAEWLAAREGLV
jgi:hypothetical protein